MSVTLGTITFDGWRGTIQRPKPVFEKYTRLGDYQLHFQRLRTESQESQIQAWVIKPSLAEAQLHERSIADVVGQPLVFTDVNVINGVFIHDYTHSIRAGANGMFLVEYNLTIVCDEVEGEA
jgi:hypothetical protein